MLKKIKENIGLVATAIALMGSVGAGIQSLTAVVNTLQGIDERMNNIEYEFQTLKESTIISSSKTTSSGLIFLIINSDCIIKFLFFNR